jgi:hypothetical protein
MMRTLERLLRAGTLHVGVVVVLCLASGGSAVVAADPAAAQVTSPPRLLVLQRSSLDAPGYIFVAPKRGATATGPEIFDDRGRPVWFNPVGEAMDFRVQQYHGEAVLTWCTDGVGYIVDRSYNPVATVHAGNGYSLNCHEFLLTPQGTALVTIDENVPSDLSPVGGPTTGTAVEGIVEEIDIATGRVVFEWHSLDHVPLADTYATDEAADYFHLNAVSIDNDGNLLISGRHTSTVYKVDRVTGRTIWRLGGKHSDFALGQGVRFAWQHNPVPAGVGTIRIFDNENNGDPGASESRVIWIQLDTSAMTATLIKAITHPSALSVPSQGNAQALDNGDTFVGWGKLGRVSEFDAQGKLLFDARLSGGDDTYRAYRFAWDGQPTAPPIASAARSGRRATTVHAIWNGAAEVARWRILAGTGGTKLAPVRTVAWNGLDTTAQIAQSPRTVEVVALDSQGRVLGTSTPVRVH